MNRKLFRSRSFRFHFCASAIALAALTACGGGGGSAPGGGGGSSFSVGVLTDAEVQGVAYTTSSGVSGTTDAQGRYNFNPGDTVTFRLGGVTLGQVPATGVVTPLQLAGGNANKLTNVLVLLQSLDADGNPGNGITIPAAAATALTAIDLTVPLNAAANTAITTAMAAGGVAGTVKSEADAKAHFLSQGRKLMASNVWIQRRDDGALNAVVYFNEAGHYLIGDFGPSENNGFAGFEAGRITPTDFGTTGFELARTVAFDANGEFGMSHPQGTERYTPNGDKLTVTDAVESVTLNKMENDPSGIVGAWRFATPSTRSPAAGAIFLFFKDGTFAMVDAIGETETPEIPQNDWCGQGGVELGRYSYDAATKVVTPSAAALNTNGCVGFFESGNNPTVHRFTISADGQTAVWAGTDSGDPWQVDLVRISK